jgi:hypothetical protein
MALRYVVLVVLAPLLAVAGYLFFAIVVAIYFGLWLQDEKMYYAQYPWYHLFGAVGAMLGVLLGWVAWRMALAIVGRTRQTPPNHPLKQTGGA